MQVGACDEEPGADAWSSAVWMRATARQRFSPVRYQVSDRNRSAPRIALQPSAAELVGEACGAEVAGRHRDLAPVDREQRGPQHGEQIVTGRGGGVELPDLLELAEERRDRRTPPASSR